MICLELCIKHVCTKSTGTHLFKVLYPSKILNLNFFFHHNELLYKLSRSAEKQNISKQSGLRVRSQHLAEGLVTAN